MGFGMVTSFMPRWGVLLILLLMAGCDLFSSKTEEDELESTSAEISAAWFDLAYDLARTERLSPPEVSRILAYSGVGLYEAVVPGMPAYRSLAGQLNGLKALPRPKPGTHHWPTVANEALSAIYEGLFSGRSTATLAAIDSMKQLFAADFRTSMNPDVLDRSVEYGQVIGQSILRWAQQDGYADRSGCTYSPPTGPGSWEPTAPAFAMPLLPCWGQLRPFALSDARTCDPGAPPVYSEDPDSDFYREALEVYDVSRSLTAEQKTIASFWADNPGETGTPPGHSIAIVTQLVREKQYPLNVAAELYARVGIAVADAFISCWETKYTYNLLRPITYIRAHIDPEWAPLVATPPFPEYSSGHSVQSGAAAQVLTDVLGPLAFTDRIHETRGLAARSFNSFAAFADEAAISRLYGGIHFRAAIERGVTQGTCIGARVSALKFRR